MTRTSNVNGWGAMIESDALHRESGTRARVHGATFQRGDFVQFLNGEISATGVNGTDVTGTTGPTYNTTALTEGTEGMVGYAWMGVVNTHSSSIADGAECKVYEGPGRVKARVFVPDVGAGVSQELFVGTPLYVRNTELFARPLSTHTPATDLGQFVGVLMEYLAASAVTADAAHLLDIAFDGQFGGRHE